MLRVDQNTEHENLRLIFREIYMACGDTPHPDWEEYDKAMIAYKTVIVLVKPVKTYGFFR